MKSTKSLTQQMSLYSSTTPLTTTKTKEIPADVLNPLLTCGLCKGYLRDAHLLTDCVHVFCKSCIIIHFDKSIRSNTKRTCPTCQTIITGSKSSYEIIKPDRLLQSIINKLLPSLNKDDQKLEEAFYAERGIAMKEGERKKMREAEEVGMDDGWVVVVIVVVIIIHDHHVFVYVCIVKYFLIIIYVYIPDYPPHHQIH